LPVPVRATATKSGISFAISILLKFGLLQGCSPLKSPYMKRKWIESRKLKL